MYSKVLHGLWGFSLCFFLAFFAGVFPPFFATVRQCYAQSVQPPEGQSQAPQETQMPDTNDGLWSLPYLQGDTVALGRSGVVFHDRSLAYGGLNLYSSDHASEAFLADMNGELLHRWGYDLAPKSPYPDSLFWSDIHVFDNGDLLAMNARTGLVKIDKNSLLLWNYPCDCHHDFFVDDEGVIYALSQKPALVNGTRIWDNLITVVSFDGKLIKEVSLLELSGKYSDPLILQLIQSAVKRHFGEEGPLDVFHANSIQAFDGTLSGQSPFFAKGNVLVSIPTFGLLAIIDLKSEKIVWHLRRELWSKWQHDAKLLPDGNILLFQNLYNDKRSRVIEFDPLTRRLVWEYIGGPDNKEFFTEFQGKNYRLPNGNVLIVETYGGRAFEVTRQKKLAWEFVNPHCTGKDNAFRAGILRMKRLRGDFPLDWLGQVRK